MALDHAVVAVAEQLGPVVLRTLDAIHLASALSLPELHAMVFNDRRLATAATAQGLRVFSPGQV